MVWNSSSLTNSHMECFQEVINDRTRPVLPLRDDIVERSRETARQAVPPEMIIDCQLLQRSIWTASWWLSPSRKSSSLDTRTCTTFKPSSQQDSTEEILISQRYLPHLRSYQHKYPQVYLSFLTFQSPFAPTEHVHRHPTRDPIYKRDMWDRSLYTCREMTVGVRCSYTQSSMTILVF